MKVIFIVLAGLSGIIWMLLLLTGGDPINKVQVMIMYFGWFILAKLED